MIVSSCVKFTAATVDVSVARSTRDVRDNLQLLRPVAMGHHLSAGNDFKTRRFLSSTQKLLATPS